jgi:CRISPR-associated protein Cas5d
MLDNEIIRVKVSREFCLLHPARPESGKDDIPLHDALSRARYSRFDTVKPEFQWYVRRIIVLNPVRFFSVKRNEINSKTGKKSYSY